MLVFCMLTAMVVLLLIIVVRMIMMILVLSLLSSCCCNRRRCSRRFCYRRCFATVLRGFSMMAAAWPPSKEMERPTGLPAGPGEQR
jgi:hypothetical protein